jgi:protein gp37
MKHHASRVGLTSASKAGPVWNGQVRFNEGWLLQPLRWKRPRRIFVCAHGDLFHDSVPDEWIDRVFAVMALAPRHQFQVLTKRAERMRDYVQPLVSTPVHRRPSRRRSHGRHTDAMLLASPPLDADELLLAGPRCRNVWLGVSVEDQRRADERIPLLLDTPAAVRWLSCEPLLGPVDLSEWLVCPNWSDTYRWT